MDINITLIISISLKVLFYIIVSVEHYLCYKSAHLNAISKIVVVLIFFIILYVPFKLLVVKTISFHCSLLYLCSQSVQIFLCNSLPLFFYTIFSLPLVSCPLFISINSLFNTLPLDAIHSMPIQFCFFDELNHTLTFVQLV